MRQGHVHGWITTPMPTTHEVLQDDPAEEVSVMVQRDTTNRPPEFPDQDGDEDNGVQNDSTTRYVMENAA